MKKPHKARAEIQPRKVSAGERKVNKSLIQRERMLFKWGLMKQITFYMYKLFCLNLLSTSETPQLLAPSSSPSFVSEHINSGVSKSICCVPSPHTVLCNCSAETQRKLGFSHLRRAIKYFHTENGSVLSIKNACLYSWLLESKNYLILLTTNNRWMPS